jgi:CubicO group peptidase (beta-lactamase class C family)
MAPTRSLCSLVLILTQVVCTCLQAAEAPVPNADLNLPSDFAAKATEYMKARARNSGFNGAVLVAYAGRPIFRHGYGLASHEFDVPNTPKTKFYVGSVTKQFTAAAIMLLEDRGKLKVTDSLKSHLPNCPDAWAEITLHHLLSHTAGLPRLTVQAMSDVSGFTRPTRPNRLRSILELGTPDERLQPLDFNPGEKFAYSNFGYLLLGMVIEEVSGKEYTEFLRDELFRPLGMNDTGCDDANHMVVKRQARGYTRVGDGLGNAIHVDKQFPQAAGAVYSTVDDLLIWDCAIYSDLLSLGSRAKLFKPVQNDYAYGWWTQTVFDRRVQWHRGNIPGFVAIIARYPDERLFVAVLSNVDRTPVRAIANELTAIAFGEQYELPRELKEAAIDPALFDRCVGQYHKEGQADDSFIFSRDGRKLLIEIPGAGSFEVFAASSERLFARSTDYNMTVVNDDNGNVSHIHVRRDGLATKWLKSERRTSR